MELKEILENYKKNKIDLEECLNQIKKNQYEDLGYAKIDHNRKERTGISEVIFCQNKEDDFLINIFKKLLKENKEVLGTRASTKQYELIKKEIPEVKYNDISHILKIEKEKELIGNVVVLTAGTADIRVAEEAAETLEFFGSKVIRIYDCGVSGIHRLLNQIAKLNEANVIIAVAGMEGALASVVAGLVKVPVIAVPTSVGYGANFGGLSALLTMLNSCSNGIATVNIDNGYGAAYIANQINKLICGKNE